ncbi:Hypothetical predicted protein, partial [Olea europaea subsp. europaea]
MGQVLHDFKLHCAETNFDEGSLIQQNFLHFGSREAHSSGCTLSYIRCGRCMRGR